MKILIVISALSWRKKHAVHCPSEKKWWAPAQGKPLLANMPTLKLLNPIYIKKKKNNKKLKIKTNSKQ